MSDVLSIPQSRRQCRNYHKQCNFRFALPQAYAVGIEYVTFCPPFIIFIAYKSEMSVRIPYVNTGSLQKSDESFIDLLKNRVCPHFQFCSFSTLVIAICLAIFISSRIVYAPGGYRQFLQHPKELDDWILNIEKVKHDKKYFYELVTAMFMHYSYRHIIMNVIFGVFIMYELQYCWRWSILVSLLAGFAAHCIAMATMSGQLLGLSGALCACLGIQFSALLLHCNYLRQVYGPQFYLIFVMSVMVLFMIIGFSQSGLIHFFGLCFGLLFGLALYPRMPEASINQNIDKVFKIFGVAFLGLAVLLGMIA